MMYGGTTSIDIINKNKNETKNNGVPYITKY